VVPIVYSLAGKAKMPMAYAIASVTTIGYLGFLINPLIVGFISEAFNMRWAFGLMAVFAIAISLISALVNQHLKK
jgi:MFS family permease